MHVDMLTPPLFQFGLFRLDTAASNNAATYRADIEFFKANSTRRMYIRSAAVAEFDVEITDTRDWLQVPRLHLLITKLCTGTHTVTPVYRGKPFFKDDIQTDGEVGTILAEMSRRGGYDLGELMKFASENASPDKIIAPVKGMIH